MRMMHWELAAAWEKWQFVAEKRAWTRKVVSGAIYRMLQSKAGQVNLDYVAQKALVAKVEKGEISVEDLRSKIVELYAAELEAAKA